MDYIDNYLSSSESIPQLLIFEELDNLIGMTSIKNKIKRYALYMQFLQLRKDFKLETDIQVALHSVFVGNPGTGKTTIAKLLGKIYRNLGLLSKGHVHTVDRANFIGEYIGHTAPIVKHNISLARGGILFIDEAYALSRSYKDSRDFGKEAIEILLTELSDGPGNIAIIVAGYPQEMAEFINSNPGLRSRFKNYFYFEDYSVEELLLIADKACLDKKVALTKLARKILAEIIVQLHASKDKSFGNARIIIDLIEEAKIQLGVRIIASKKLSELNKFNLSIITGKDMELVKKERISSFSPDVIFDHQK